MKIPRGVRSLILHFEVALEDAVRDFAARQPAGSRVLDAGAGEGQYAHFFTHNRYTGVDLAVGDVAWNYSGLDVIADLNSLPFPNSYFDASLNVVTLEHVCEPAAALRGIARTLRPGAEFLLIVPFEWEAHQEPHDYFRYSRHGVDYLLRKSGFDPVSIEPVGGLFRLLSRRLASAVQFFMRGKLWLLFPFAMLFFAPPALLLPLLDPLDEKKAFTLGYIAIARRNQINVD